MINGLASSQSVRRLVMAAIQTFLVIKNMARHDTGSLLLHILFTGHAIFQSYKVDLLLFRRHLQYQRYWDL